VELTIQYSVGRLHKKNMKIDMYGLVIECSIDSHEFAEQLTRPFKYFIVEKGLPLATIVVKDQPPPYESFPKITASFSTPRNIIYENEDLKIVDYFGKGAVVEDGKQSTFIIYGSDRNFSQEAFYLLVMSLFGQHCDKRKMLRVHALAVSYKNKAILLPIPPGGGKSTMGLALLKEKEFMLISDDEPVVKNDGAILPFPLRIGTLDREKLKDIPPEFVYSIDRMEFGLKYFIDIQYWKNKLECRSLNDVVLISSKRVLNGQPLIEKVTKCKVLKSLIRDSVIGVGLYQGLEFMLNKSMWSSLSLIGTACKRFVIAVKLLRNSDTYSMTLSSDVDDNVQVFKEFVRTLQ